MRLECVERRAAGEFARDGAMVHGKRKLRAVPKRCGAQLHALTLVYCYDGRG